MGMTFLHEIGSGVHVLRHPVLDVNATLVVGGESALVVDTLSTAVQAQELLAAVRRVTALPLTVVNTHHHFDHSFGNQVFAGAKIWAHEEAARLIGPAMHARAAVEYPDMASELACTTPSAPTELVRAAADLDLGDRPVQLRHFGRGHSIGDLAVLVPDADVLIAGDLVEESGPPQFDDAYPLDWPDTVAALLTRLTPDSLVVPGHGAVVGLPFVTAQHEHLAALAWLIREGDADGAPPERVAAKSPFPQDVSLPAVQRGYLQLNALT
ncbi:MBL fold metallo-hydrolase [Dactylosporangium vinaceum]|nr:MBL fold metallo-hydrolase [Dactylosporangium vinaceum]UAB98476.1 MBL fold metallo-hydrolase [Dactylosporangium vinaceum]